MTVDLLWDWALGDAVSSPSNDFELCVGLDVVAQRMRVRIKVQIGTWTADPTGEVGSTLKGLLRMPVFRVIQEIPVVVKEALAPMEDVDVLDVTAEQDTDDPSGVQFTVSFRMNDGESTSDVLTFTDLVQTA